ncbi:MAG: NYN domain-containing protein [Acidobacteria bacterium]|nr:NYN domain-containing protein [Acidobacteriota bacterium]
MIDTRLKIAVFIDFDNIEIGVKTTLNLQLDVAAILEGIKERGEVVTKVAYGDWKRAGDYGRLLSQHAIRMVQRNVTPGGDKNGADINLALDALEMAFTHDHINAFVIVGGDSDFITLVEKLKQYDKKVFVVGGRQFTSFVMQKNCHEFIAYENLVGVRRATTERRGDTVVSAPADVAKVIPLVKRALKVLADREVSPQLGLLKSTLLQLDSAFSERDYGTSSFRDFIEKIAKTGVITLRHSGRSMMVDLADATTGPEPVAAEVSMPPQEIPVVAAVPPPAAPAVVDPAQAQQLFQRVQDIFHDAGVTPRWPMYIRQLKQYLRAGDPTFDERVAGFSTTVEFLKACQREGVLHLDRDRRGQLRVFPGVKLARSPVPVESSERPEPDEPIEPVDIEPVEVAIDPPRPGGGRSPRRPRPRKTTATKTPKRGARVN